MNVLIAGCSFSASNTSTNSGVNDAGWLPENAHLHYPNILKKDLGCNINNIAQGGCSNREIYLRVVEACLNEKPDLCIVQWSNLNRLWVYEDNTVDDCTMLLPVGITGLMSDKNSARNFHKIWFRSYQNRYMFLKHWLEDQILLQTFLQHNRIPYVFVRGFPNFISELENLISLTPILDISSINIPDTIKDMLHFDDNPDNYLLEKLLVLTNLYAAIDKSRCIGYNTNNNVYGLSYNRKDIDDYADDGMHPGAKTNQDIANQILNFLKEDNNREFV